MKIYVIEAVYDYATPIGWSTSRKIAEEKCKELSKYEDCWVEEYQTDESNWCEFTPI